ncbi:iron-containing alcohol dehydrogenase PsrA [Caballeronia sp. 15715]|uniref:iron-containing alcohol dehydrogenase PsrA n=1 Tax=unclassified Caballeronia TaxID=2646786 RepID=UPI0039E248A0
MNGVFLNPVEVHFGLGCIERLPQVLGDRRAVIVTFPEAAQIGLVQRVRALCGDSVVAVIDDVQPNPDVTHLAGLYRDFWQRYDWQSHEHCSVIVAIGGGSVLDTAKTLMVGTESGDFAELLALLDTGKPFTPPRVKSLITVPTTSGTGSEVTPWATIWDRTIKQRKYSLQLPQTWPEAAIVDPELTLSLPLSVTVQSGLDALSHALEAIWNVNANPISDEFAVSAARDMLATLPALAANLQDRTLRERASLAALKAGLAFSNTKTALAHSISYEMTIHHGLPHGIACSFTLPMVLDLALGKNAGRDAVLAKIFPCRLADAAAYLTGFLESLGVRTSFSSYGVTAEESDRMIAHALSGPRGRNFIATGV